MMKKEFTELRTATTESLMFVKEDLIIAHFYTFQDFIATKMMGKTGPLWKFDASGEIRVRQDAVLDCGDSHPVKVVLRSWYEKVTSTSPVLNYFDLSEQAHLSGKSVGTLCPGKEL